MPEVSIIVPVYNVEKYLERCVNSLLGQTLTDIEIILVDDGSPDNCPKMCDEYARKDSRVKVIHKQNAGLGYARNSGLEIATGKYIAFVDSDDYVDVTMFQKLSDASQNGFFDVVYSGVNAQKRDGTTVSEYVSDRRLAGAEIYEFVKNIIASAPEDRVERKEPMSVWHSIYRKSIFDGYGIRFKSEREILSEDILFDVKYLPHCNNIRFYPEALYNYCYNGESLSQVFNIDKIYRLMALRTELLKLAEEDQDLSARITRFTLGYVRAFLMQVFRMKTSLSDKHACCSHIYSIDYVDLINNYPLHSLPIWSKVVLFTSMHKMFYLQLLIFSLIDIFKK